MPGMHRDRVEPTPRAKQHDRIRLAIQLAAAALANGYAVGFARGKIFTGSSKMVCIPVLNCDSCPGALSALQAVAGGVKHNVSFYVLGTLMLFGVLLGRLICGLLCPFGLVQDLMYRIPVRKLRVLQKIDKPLRCLKYVILAVFVILLPVFAVDQFGIALPYFCKYICPAGTLEGGIPHLFMSEELRRLAGVLFGWKLGVLITVLVGSMFISRCFCRYLCPLGAFYSLFNRFSLYGLELDHAKCIGCGTCESVCLMALDVRKNINSTECIRCGKCKAACPAGAIARKGRDCRRIL